MHELGSASLVWLIPALPLVGFLINAFFGKKLGKTAVGGIATAIVFVSFAIGLIVLKDLMGVGAEERRAIASLIPGQQNVPWINIGNFRVDFNALIDPLSMLMVLIVTGVGGLIHLYATGYMADDRDFPRFFTYLNLFIFFMLMLVLGANILLMFVGWEGVGLCSYLLISFWFEDMENSKAGNKAFIVNRIGDVGFGLGIMAIFATFGTLTFYAADGKGFLDLASKGLTSAGPLEVATATTIALLLFVGACGKSAQFPLYVWLPDAMAGPTPVSALIHAATMVTAGVVMITRVSPIVVQSGLAMSIIAGIGLFTAVLAATIAISQNDIKKVLAYSTVSQLGYMFLGCGVGAFWAGMFHVTTHAFFKALLFLGAGAVIYAMRHEQDMRKMGGLAKKIPAIYWTMMMGYIAICGVFPFAGLWSKDAILGAALAEPTWGKIYYVVGLATAVLTAFYMSRLMWKTFWSEQRFDEAELGQGHHSGHDDDTHAQDSHGESEDAADHAAAGEHHALGIAKPPMAMVFPLAVLAVLSVIGGFVGIPGSNAMEHFLEPSIAPVHIVEPMNPWVGIIIGTAAGLLGIGIAYLQYSKHRKTGEILAPEAKAHNPLYQGSAHLWYWDQFTTWLGVHVGGVFATFWAWFDRNIVDGIVNLVANVTGLLSEGFRRIQTGFVGSYATLMLVGVVAVVVGLLWPVIMK